MKILLPSFFVKKIINVPINWKTMDPLKVGKQLVFKHEIEQYRFYDDMPQNDYSMFHQYSSTLYSEFCSILKKFNAHCLIIIFYSWSNYQSKKRFWSPKLAVITNDEKYIKRVFFDATMYKAFPAFVIFPNDVVIIPTDHMDMFITAKNNCDLNQYLDLELFRTTDWGN